MGSRALSTLSILSLAGVLCFPVTASPQLYRPFSNDLRNPLEGNWQSCKDTYGEYPERVYDHIVNGIGKFEVHMGPFRQFAIFLGVQDEHRDHATSENLLGKSYDLRELKNNGAKQRWEIPKLGLAFTATMAGGSRTDCESWYLLLEPLPVTH